MVFPVATGRGIFSVIPNFLLTNSHNPLDSDDLKELFFNGE